MESYNLSNHNVDYSKIIRSIIIIAFMVIGGYSCFKMLRWVTENKFQQLPQVAPSEITAQYRERQLACLARNIYFEAGNEPFEGKVAVAQVTVNRASARGFPDDICQVVYQKNVIYQRVVCQFSWYCDRDTSNRVLHKEVYDQSMEAAKKVLLEGFRLPSLTESLYYHADYVNPGWRRERITKIGRHIFYK